MSISQTSIFQQFFVVKKGIILGSFQQIRFRIMSLGPTILSPCFVFSGKYSSMLLWNLLLIGLKKGVYQLAIIDILWKSN